MNLAFMTARRFWEIHPRAEGLQGVVDGGILWNGVLSSVLSAAV